MNGTRHATSSEKEWWMAAERRKQIGGRQNGVADADTRCLAGAISESIR